MITHSGTRDEAKVVPAVGQLLWAGAFKARTIENGPMTEWRYSISFAVGVCYGEIDGIRCAWADGKPIDLSAPNIRIYCGGPGQDPDPAIVADLGVAAPAFRKISYVVFEDLPLKAFGNRIPKLEFEIDKKLK